MRKRSTSGGSGDAARRSSICCRTVAVSAAESRCSVAVFTAGDARALPSTPSVCRYLVRKKQSLISLLGHSRHEEQL